jgi:hypothetical protein
MRPFHRLWETLFLGKIDQTFRKKSKFWPSKWRFFKHVALEPIWVGHGCSRLSIEKVLIKIEKKKNSNYLWLSIFISTFPTDNLEFLPVTKFDNFWFNHFRKSYVNYKSSSKPLLFFHTRYSPFRGSIDGVTGNAWGKSLIFWHFLFIFWHEQT